jgi:uncharacterized membrane protein YphA (DoxX/SURF4 family)
VTGTLGRVAGLGVGGVMVAGLAAEARAPGGLARLGTDAGAAVEARLLALGAAAVLVWRGSGAMSLDGRLSRGAAARENPGGPDTDHRVVRGRRREA